MRLCIISDGDFHSNYGGGQIYVRNLVDYFNSHIDPIIVQCSVVTNHRIEGKIGPSEYGNFQLWGFDNENDAFEILRIVKPQIVHVNGNYLLFSKLCNALGIKCVATIHDSMWTCPNVTYLNTKHRLCSNATSIPNCLKCELSRITLGKFAYPFLKHIPVEKIISIGKKIGKLPFLYYFTPVLQAANRIEDKMTDWRVICDSFDVVIEISSRMAQMALKNGLPDNKLRVVKNGIPSPRQDFPFPATSKVIKFYYVGRISYSKGVPVLLEAFSRIREKNVELHIIGEGGDCYEKMMHKYRLDNRIKWHGFIPHEKMYEVVSEFHVLIHPSIGAEAFGLTVAEALSLGKFVIATQCGGPEDQIDVNNNGWLVPPNNTDALHKCMELYLKQPERPFKVSYNEMEPHVDTLMSIYYELLS